MGISKFFKNTVKNNTNVKGWTSWDAIKENGKTIRGFIDDAAGDGKEAPTHRTFEEAMKEFGLSEHDIAHRMKVSLWASIFCGILSLAALGWTVFLFTKTMYLSSLVGIALSALMLSYGFREHFYYFQMKQRRLNCTFQEWLQSFHPGKKNKK